MNFDELLAAYSCKAVSVLFKFAHLFLLLYLLCYPYWQFFMSFPMFWAVYFIVYSVWWWFPLFEFWLIKWHSSFNYSFVIRYFNLFFSISLQNSDQSGFLGNCPPTLSLSHITYLSLRAKCWLRGGVGGQFPKNLNWSQNSTVIKPRNITVIYISVGAALAVLLLGAAIFIWCYRRKRKKGAYGFVKFYVLTA